VCPVSETKWIFGVDTMVDAHESSAAMLSPAVANPIQHLLVNHVKPMSSLVQPLTAWSFEAEDETALRAYGDELSAFAQECRDNPGEEAAMKACGASRNVWNTVEGMLHANASVNNQLLADLIQGIESCIEAVSQMPLLPQVPPRVSDHIREIITAMTERRDDLVILMNEGRMAFLERFRMGEVPAA
jgi:hypothetical protein